MVDDTKTTSELIALCTKLLHELWNPIGCGVPDDEYATYAPAVARYVKANNPVTMGAYLENIRCFQMSMPKNTLADYIAAYKIWTAARKHLEREIK